jgi:hypothetical protein
MPSTTEITERLEKLPLIKDSKKLVRSYIDFPVTFVHLDNFEERLRKVHSEYYPRSDNIQTLDFF